MSERIGLSSAWVRAEEALPPGWRVRMCIERGDIWTVQAGPKSWGSMMRYGKVTGKRIGRHVKGKDAGFQVQGDTLPEALLNVAEWARTNLDRRFWDFHPERVPREQPDEAWRAAFEGTEE